MTEVIRLVRVDFDNLENRDGRMEKEIGIFGPTPTGSAYATVQRWFSEQEPIKFYAGWDHQVYPQFRMETRILRGGADAG